MAIIDIKLSQSDVDVSNTLTIKNGPPSNGILGTMVDLFAVVNYSIGKSYPTYSSYSWVGSTLTLYASDGATDTYTGVVRADPNASQGTATATGYEFYKDGWLTYAQSGLTNFNYTITTTNGITDISFFSTGGLLSAGKITTLLPSNSTSYSAELGNVSILLNGSVHSDSNHNLSGNISKITETADKTIFSAVIEGNFQVSGNSLTMGQGLTFSNVSGLLTSYKDDSRDGSYTHITDISTYISATQTFDEKILADASRFSGDDVINIDLPSRIYSDYLMASGAGNDQITIKGGGGRLSVNAGSGSDVITIGSDNHIVDGGSGLDTAIFAGNLSTYNFSQIGATTTVSPKAGISGTDMLTNVERLQFSDTYIALDIAGTAGQAYRLYQAAFDRKPDLAGLGYWIKDMDKGTSLTTVAAGFFQSSEFQKLYGSNPNTTTLITNFYQNVLHRAPDQAGFDYWAGELNTGKITPAGALASFCESTENQALVIGSIQNGIEYTPWLG